MQIAADESAAAARRRPGTGSTRTPGGTSSARGAGRTACPSMPFGNRFITSGRSATAGRMIRRDLHVVAEQIALGQLLLRPEHLVQVGDRELLAVRKLEHAVAPCLLRARAAGRQRARSGCGVRARPGLTSRRFARFAVRALAIRATATLNRASMRTPNDASVSRDVLRLLVVAQSEIHRMPQLAVGRPLGELDLRDERRLRPSAAARWSSAAANGHVVGLERLEQLHQARELALVEAGAGVADVERPCADRAAPPARRRRAAARRSTRASAAARSSRRSTNSCSWTIFSLRQSGVRLPDW